MAGAPKAVTPSVNGWNAEFLEAEYRRFQADPASVPDDLRSFFLGFDLGVTRPAPAAAVGAPALPGGGASEAALRFQFAVGALIEAYRSQGHLAAAIDPFGRPRPRPEALNLAHHGLSEADLDRPVHVGSIRLHGLGATPTLRQVVEHLEKTYCRATGAEFMHIPHAPERLWFIEKLEGGTPDPSAADRAEILEHLTSAEAFEGFLGKRYRTKKRFSLEGGESLIPLLKRVTRRAGELGAQEIVLGMPHRGRLSVLRNYLSKDLQRLFTEFEDSWADGENQSGGDVKYHRGYSGDQALPDGRLVHLSMLNNPSHLESVDPIVMGRCRAKQDNEGDAERRRIVSLLIHGDAAVAGQGVVAECLAMSQLEGYTVGGTIHVVVNNLVGFTTDPEDGRSTVYCTDIAKTVNAPVLHVCGEDPEAVVAAAALAAEYRHEFRRDIFIDLVCFRRHGHNEVDEPTFTQPELYALVREHPGTAELYRRRLREAGVVTVEAAQAMVDGHFEALDKAQTSALATPVNPVPAPGDGLWKGFTGKYTFDSPPTAVKPAVIAEVCAAMGRAPEGFNVHPKLRGMLQARADLPKAGKLSHADAEQIAIGTLLLDGVPARLSGQDARRGTFTQRHAVLRDQETGERYTALNHIREGQAKFSAWDSPLSEFGVMGFDFGYSRGAPRTLVMWEAQFGDFVNGAQVIIDQYLASSETKWSRWAGLVLLLPHGYEGQGPEHSSARMERFLQLCADDNMEVVYPASGAQMFHLLRRQALRGFRKPLIVMTPKKYLRAETGTIDELSTGSFRHLIDDPAIAAKEAAAVTRVVYCSGKLCHELAARRDAAGRRDVAVVRVEQLYPFHLKLAREIDARYPAKAERVWAQEEPKNQGAWTYMDAVFREQMGVTAKYIGRPPSASPAVGSEHAHIGQQDRILGEAIGPAAKDAPGPIPISAGKAKPEGEAPPAAKAPPSTPAARAKR